jgi:hypothetical protein
LANTDGGIRKGGPLVVDGDSTHFGLLEIESKASGFSSGLEHFECDFHYFGTDSVTGENCEF